MVSTRRWYLPYNHNVIFNIIIKLLEQNTGTFCSVKLDILKKNISKKIFIVERSIPKEAKNLQVNNISNDNAHKYRRKRGRQVLSNKPRESF